MAVGEPKSRRAGGCVMNLDLLMLIVLIALTVASFAYISALRHL